MNVLVSYVRILLRAWMPAFLCLMVVDVLRWTGDNKESAAHL
jgi:hypothetical protein